MTTRSPRCRSILRAFSRAEKSSAWALKYSALALMATPWDQSLDQRRGEIRVAIRILMAAPRSRVRIAGTELAGVSRYNPA